MKRLLVLMAIVVAMLIPSGCGTISSFQERDGLYPATTMDVLAWSVILSYSEYPENLVYVPAVSLFTLIDLPISLTMDTLMLPYDLYKNKPRKGWEL